MKKHYKILIIAIVALAMLMAFVGCEVTHEYEVYFVSDGEHYQNMEVITGSNFALPTDPQKDGYTFGGWWTANGISNDNWGDLFTANYVTETTITVFAKWTANSYTVVYDGNGATAGGMADQIMVYDQQADLSANAFVKTDTYLPVGAVHKV